MSVVVRVMGPLEVISQGRPVLISAGKERGLLVLLALQSGRVVPSERLIEALWDGEPPPSVETSLRVLVSRVRKTMSQAGAGRSIITRSPGYVLNVDEVDVAAFEALCLRGHHELADGRFAAASATLTQALALWRGERLAQAGTRYLQAESDRFAEVRLTALEARIEADLARGRHADVLGDLAVLCPANPLREGLWAQWIRAYYRSGRQADALQTYQNLRAALGTELGIDPSPALRRLEEMVLAQDPRLEPRELSPPPDRRHLPAALDIGERVALAGRDADLHALAAAWATACAGRSATVLVSGHAGIGKSRLLREFARTVQHGEGIVLHGRCDPELAIPYQPFVECMSEAVTASPDGVLAVIAAPKLAELARMVPDLASRRNDLPSPAKADPDVERYLLFGAAAALLTALARTAPVLLILDDLHWADRTTLQLMTYLCWLNLGRVLFVGAHRGSERPDGPLVETLGGLHRNADVTRVALHGLTAQHVVALMTTVTGRELDDRAVELAHLLHQQSAGNPFYVTEMLRHLVETGVIIELPDGGCTASVAIGSAGFPDSIREVLTARVARVGDRAASTLSMAAVIGQEFDIDVLASAAAIGEDDVLDLLEATARTALVQEVDHQVGRYRFAHALVQQTLYTGLSPTRRTRAHARVAAAMETLDGREPGELAYHYLAGLTSASTARAIHHARAAGQRALAISAPNEAVRWYSAALNALPPPRDDLEHARLQLDLGIAQRQAADPNYRETLLSTARTAQHNGADDLLVEAAIAVNPGGFSSLGQVDTEKVEVLESALTVVGSNAKKRARLLAALSGELTWHPDHRRRIQLADEAVAVARRSGDAEALLDAIIRPAAATWVPQTSARRARLFREAVDLADRAHDPMARNHAVGLLAPTLLEQGVADRFEDALDVAAKVAIDIREPLLQWVTLLSQWCLTIVRGDLELAEAQGAQLLQLGMDSADAREGHAEVLGIVRWHQGRLPEALPGLRTALARLRGVPTRWAGLAFAEAIGGDRGQAKVMLGEAASNDFDIPYGPAWLGTMCHWAAVAAELGDVDAAATLYTKLRPWKELFGTGGPMPVHGVSHALGRLAALLGQPETAEQHFARAWRIHQTMRAPFYTAETGLYWGQMLIPSNPDRARTLLTQALELARTHGFGDIERHAIQTLATA